jgi:hypothetical protein
MKKLSLLIILVLMSVVSLPSFALAEDEECLDVQTIHVYPGSTNVPYGGDVRFRAYAYDSDEKRIEGFEVTSWNATAGIMHQDGHYVANIVGWHTVDAIYIDTCSASDPAPRIVTGKASVRVFDRRP